MPDALVSVFAEDGIIAPPWLGYGRGMRSLRGIIGPA